MVLAPWNKCDGLGGSRDSMFITIGEPISIVQSLGGRSGCAGNDGCNENKLWGGNTGMVNQRFHRVHGCNLAGENIIRPRI